MFRRTMVTRSMSLNLQKQMRQLQQQLQQPAVDEYESHYTPSASFRIYDIPLGRQESLSTPHSVLCKHLIATAMFHNGEIVETHARGSPLVIRDGKIDYRRFKTIGDWLDQHTNAETLFKGFHAETEKIEIVHSHPNAVTVCAYKSKKGRK